MDNTLIGDLVLLETINENEVNETLQSRYKKNHIYTYIGPVLISLNPFKNIPDLYSIKTMHNYENRSYWERPPHIFALSECIYKSLYNQNKNQCVIISGESGSGKTEASKLVLKYISEASNNIQALEDVKNKLIATNPILESFGNAKTIRNDNSSRFGKYFEIIFDYGGNPVGGIIKNYLLEKVRVVNPAHNERNYHIFYQILYGIEDKNEKNDLYLLNPEEYNIINQSESMKIGSIDDKKDFFDTVRAMKISGFSDKEINQLKKILSSILLLGQIKFLSNDNDHAQILDTSLLEKIADLLSLSKELLLNTLISRKYDVKGNITVTQLNLMQAEYTKNSLCKDMYSKLFDWIIKKINIIIDPKIHLEETQHKLIGVLDIYGFEIFEHNSFEQFCINYVNEKLQQIFIEQTLKTEQEEYEEEDIQWTPVEYFNNKIVCELIEKPNRSILALIDEECILPKGNDLNFLNKLESNFNKHDHFEKMKKKNDSFVLKHYAGDVVYEVEGFLSKNKDLVWKDLIMLCEKSDLAVLKSIYSGLTKNFSLKRPETQATQFKKQVFSLIESLLQCKPHYIRCIKPNDRKSPDNYDKKRVLHQIKYLGLKENIRVRRAGFAFRMEYSVFVDRYKMINEKTWPYFSDKEKDATENIIKSIDCKKSIDYELGKTKIFIKLPQTVFKLDLERNKKIENLILKMQSIYRCFIERKKLAEKISAQTIQQHFKKYLKILKDIKERDNSKNIYKNLKIRREFTLGLFPVGDYLKIENNFNWKNKNKTSIDKSNIVFSDFCQKINRNFKFEKRLVIITQKNIIISRYKIAKNSSLHWKNIKKFGKIRKFPLSQCNQIMVGEYSDNICVLKIDKLYDIVLTTERKSELISAIKRQNSDKNVEVVSGKSIEYKIKNKSSQKINFVKSETSTNQLLKVVSKRKIAQLEVFMG